MCLLLTTRLSLLHASFAACDVTHCTLTKLLAAAHLSSTLHALLAFIILLAVAYKHK